MYGLYGGVWLLRHTVYVYCSVKAAYRALYRIQNTEYRIWRREKETGPVKNAVNSTLWLNHGCLAKFSSPSFLPLPSLDGEVQYCACSICGSRDVLLPRTADSSRMLPGVREYTASSYVVC